MTAYDQAMLLLAACGVLTAAAAFLSVRRLDRFEREIADRKAAQHPAE